MSANMKRGTREALQAANNVRESVVNKIKATAADFGEVEGPRTVLTGTKYVVGFVTANPNKQVDWAMFAKRRPKLYASLCSMQIDEGKVERALADGTLPRALLEKYVVPAGKPTDRVLCEEIGKEKGNDYELD